MGDLEILFADIGPYLWAGLAALVLLLALWLLSLHLRLGRMSRTYRQLVSGVDEGTLEDLLERELAAFQQIAKRVDDQSHELSDAQAALERAVQRVGLVRFNPFTDTGGDQSFSIALLDARGNGLVLSSLFSRAETRVFAKPVEKGQSKYALTDEEQQAISLARSAERPARPR